MRFACRTSILISCLFSIGLILSGQTLLAAKRPPIVGIAHIAFQVSDMANARAFYGDLLGYEEPFRLFQEDGSVMLTFFKVSDRQFIEIFPGLPPGQDERLSHIALENHRHRSASPLSGRKGNQDSRKGEPRTRQESEYDSDGPGRPQGRVRPILAGLAAFKDQRRVSFRS